MPDWFVPHNRWVNRPEYEAAALRVLRSGHVAQGPEVEAFEHELAARFRPDGAACVVSSGTMALHLALKARDADSKFDLGFKSPWPEKLKYPWSVPTYACSSVYEAVEYANPVDDYYQPTEFVDVDCETFNAAASATVTVQTYGSVSGPGPIEDFTHAPGASLYREPCGSLGDLSVISFGATKPLGIGAGGAVLGPPEVIKWMRGFRDIRFNVQLGDVYAAIGRERLKRLDEENEWRDKTALLYRIVGSLRCDTQTSAEGSLRTHYRHVIRVADWRRAQDHFASMGIETINPLRPDELLHRIYSSKNEYRNAEAIAASTLSLPIWPGMSDEQVTRVGEALGTLEA